MIPLDRAGHDERGGQPGTLGDVIYRDAAASPVSEKDWVALVQSIAGGDQRALHALYLRTHGLVFTLLVRITNSTESAEELTLDVFYDVWRRAAAYDPSRGSVVGWILNQARSRGIDRLRLEQRKKRVPSRPDEPAPSTGPQDDFDRREQGRRLRHALTVLTADERRAIETAFFSELTYGEVAARLNQPLGTVKTRIRSGLGKLRKALGS